MVDMLAGLAGGIEPGVWRGALSSGCLGRFCYWHVVYVGDMDLSFTMAQTAMGDIRLGLEHSGNAASRGGGHSWIWLSYSAIHSKTSNLDCFNFGPCLACITLEEAF